MTGVITNDVIARRLFLPDLEECYRIIREARWPNGIICPYCGSKEVQKNGHNPKGAQKYCCKNCDKYFNDLTGTIFAHHKFPINEMLYIIWPIPHKSIKLISEELNRNYKAVLGFVHEVQEIAGKSKVKLEDVIEIDEAYPHAGDKGFKKKNPRRRGRHRRGRGTAKSGKPPVLTIVVKKTKKAVFLVFENLRDFLKKFKERVENLVMGRLRIFTDKYTVYDSLKKKLCNIVEIHEWINHSEREFARGDVHVNTCENRHSFLRSYLVKHRGVSFKWLQGYLDFALILNNR